MLQLLCAPNPTLIFGVFPLHQIAHVWVVSRDLNLFGREIIFEVFQLCEKHTSTP